MGALLSFYKYGFGDRDRNLLRAKAKSLTPGCRQSLVDDIVETLNEHNDEEEGSENVEELLEKIELDLHGAEEQLVTLEEKEQFLALRIRKYQSLLVQQGEHLNQLQNNISSYKDDPSDNVAEQQHYQEQLAKQQNHKVALGKVVDVHLDILKHIKACKRTIDRLEEKKQELQTVTQKCREFLVTAEEVEREQQLGIEGDENDEVLMEMAPMVGEEEEGRQAVEEAADPAASRVNEEDNIEHGDEEAGQQGKELLEENEVADPSMVDTTVEKKNSAPKNAEPVDLLTSN